MHEGRSVRARRAGRDGQAPVNGATAQREYDPRRSPCNCRDDEAKSTRDETSQVAAFRAPPPSPTFERGHRCCFVGCTAGFASRRPRARDETLSRRLNAEPLVDHRSPSPPPPFFSSFPLDRLDTDTWSLPCFISFPISRLLISTRCAASRFSN